MESSDRPTTPAVPTDVTSQRPGEIARGHATSVGRPIARKRASFPCCGTGILQSCDPVTLPLQLEPPAMPTVDDLMRRYEDLTERAADLRSYL